jgi:tripartite ATP-independent transporter DctM subunit
MLGEILALLMFAASCLVLLGGFPVAFGLAGTALGFALLGAWLDVFDLRLLGGLPSRYLGVMTNEVLVAVPLFVFMGLMLERSRIAEALLETLALLFGRLRGGLAYAVTIVGALLAASTGIIGATVVAMGLISLPAMLRAGYDPKLATGSICAAGTLGQIIPPSIVLVVIGDMLQGANTQAQLAMGNFSPRPVSVVDLFAGAMLPGLVLVGLYLAWQVAVAALRPKACPALVEAGARRPPDMAARVVKVLLPPAGLILAVLGSILGGLATPTESAAVGAVGAILLTAAHRRLDLAILRAVAQGTTRVSAMIFTILLGASLFSLVFRGLGGERIVTDTLHAMPAGATGAMAAVLLLVFLLGFFLDTMEIIFVVVPIVAAPLIMLGHDPVWLGVMLGLALQTSFLTPPFGYALFYLRGVAPAEVTTLAIYRGVMPFVALQLVAVGIVWLWPALATWLPGRLFG